MGVVTEVNAREMVCHLYGKVAYWICARPRCPYTGDIITMRVRTHTTDDTLAVCVCAPITDDMPFIVYVL